MISGQARLHWTRYGHMGPGRPPLGQVGPCGIGRLITLRNLQNRQIVLASDMTWLSNQVTRNTLSRCRQVESQQLKDKCLS